MLHNSVAITKSGWQKPHKHSLWPCIENSSQDPHEVTEHFFSIWMKTFSLILIGTAWLHFPGSPLHSIYLSHAPYSSNLKLQHYSFRGFGFFRFSENCILEKCAFSNVPPMSSWHDACFFLLLNSILLFGCTKLCLMLHLLRYIRAAPKFGQLMIK